MKTYFKISLLALLMLALSTVSVAQDRQVQTLLNDSIKREKVFFTIQNNPELMKLFMQDMKKNKHSMEMMKAHDMSGMNKQEMMEKMMNMTENDTVTCKTMMKTMMGRMMKHAQSDTAVRNNMMKMMMGNMHKIMQKDPALQKEMMSKMMGNMMSKAESNPQMGKKMIAMMMEKPDMMKMMVQMMNEKGMMDEKTMNKTLKKMDKMNAGKNSQSGDHQH